MTWHSTRAGVRTWIRPPYALHIRSPHQVNQGSLDASWYEHTGFPVVHTFGMSRMVRRGLRTRRTPNPYEVLPVGFISHAGSSPLLSFITNPTLPSVDCARRRSEAASSRLLLLGNSEELGRGDEHSYRLIEDKIQSEYDLFQRGANHYYQKKMGRLSGVFTRKSPEALFANPLEALLSYR